jgi:hypothetical protein
LPCHQWSHHLPLHPPQLQASINELVVANNAYAAYLDQNKEETTAERKVLTLFHTSPEQLQVGHHILSCG